MATLSGNKIKNTYQSLVKFSDNGNITVGAKQLTDGFGNNSPMFVSTTQVGIGVTPEAGLNLHVFGDAKIGSNLTVIGNLVVEGSTTTVGTDTLTVKDPLIVLANNNTSTDAVDIGFYGKYTPSGTTLYSGLFREALTGKYRLFKGLEDEPTTTVNTSGTGYARADLVIGDLEAERGTFTDSIFVSPSLYVSDAILHTGDIDTKLEFLSDQIKFSTGGSFRLSINNSYSEFFTNVRFEDGIKAQFGDNQDLEIYHDGSNSYITDTGTGDLRIQGSNQIRLSTANGNENYFVGIDNAQVELFYAGSKKFETMSTGVHITGVVISDGLDLGDNDKIRLGDSQDLEIYHDGTNASFISNTNTTLPLQIFTDDLDIKSYSLQNNMIIANSGGAVQLYYGGSLKLSTSSTGIQVLGDLTATNGVHLADNVKASFGGSDDLEIYHNGSHAYLTNDTGNFEITTTGNLILQNASSNKWMMTNQGGGVLLYYNGGTSKLTTTPTGISINGRISGLTDPTLAQDAATKAYVDLQVGANNELSEVLSNGNTTGGNDIVVSANDDITFTDTSKAIFGGELEIYNNSADGKSYITQEGGDLMIINYSDDNDVMIQCDDGSGGVTTYLKADGSTGAVQLNHYGGARLYTSSTGISINGRISDLTDPSAAQDAATKNYVDTQIGANNELSEVLANGNTTGGTDIAVSAGDAITFSDNSKAKFGIGSDLQIYHDTVDSFIKESGIGALKITSNNTLFYNVGFVKLLANFDDIGVKLYYDNSAKFETTSYGINVTGAIKADDYISIEGSTNPYLRIQDTTNEKYLNLYSSDNESAIVYTQDTFKISSGVDFLNQTPRLTIDSSGNATFAGEVKLQSSNAFTTLRTGNDYGWSIYANSSNFLTFGSGATANTKATSWLTIQDNNGNATFAGNVEIGNTVASSMDAGANNLVVGSGSGTEGMTIYSGTSNSGVIYFADGVSGDDRFRGQIGYSHSDNSFSFRTNASSSANMVIDSSGIVKINTTAVNARFRVDEGRTSEWVAGFKHTGATPYGVFIDTSGNTSTGYTLGCYTNTGTGLFLKNDGNVGIGTTSPTSYYSGADNLVVKQDSGEGGMSIVTANDTTGAIYFADGTSGNEQYRGGIGYTHSTDKLFLVSGGQTRVWMNDSGNVGIGTDSPDAKLDIGGNTAGSVQTIFGRGNSDSAFSVRYTNGITGTSNAVQGTIGLDYANGYWADMAAVKFIRNSTAGELAFYTSASATSGVERMRITSGGLIQASAGGGGFRVVSDAVNPSNLIEYYYSSSYNHGLEVEGDRGLRMYSNTGDNSGKLTFYTEGTERMRIDSSGNVNITSGDLIVPEYIKHSGDTDTSIRFTTNRIEFYTANNEVLELEDDGQVNIISAGTSTNPCLTIGDDVNTGIWRPASDTFAVSTGGNERMRITSVGNLDFNEHTGATIGYGFRLTSASDYSQIYMEASTTSSRIIQRYYNPNGNVGNITISGSSTTYATSSDYRLKENVVEMTGALDRVSQLKPSRFNFIADANKTVDGFLAHEVQEIVPEAITGEKDAMIDEEYEVSPDVYEDVVHPAEEAVYETVEHPAVEEELDDEGNVVVEGKEAYTEEVLVAEAKEEWTEKVLVTEKVMGTREVPDYQGIDQSKLVPLLVGAIQELKAEIELLKTQINN